MSGFNSSVKGKLYAYFMDRLGLKTSTKGFLRGDCPYCGGKFCFGVNVQTSKVKCFKDCDYDTDPLKVVMFVEGFDIKAKLWEFLRLQEEYELYDKIEVRKEPLKAMDLPEEFIPLKQGKSIIAKSVRAYLKGRGFNINKLHNKGIGYCLEGKYAGYIIFPFYRKGKLYFFQGRRFTGLGPKMNNPSEEEYGIGKGSIIYNEDALYIYKRVYLVESITNAETLGDKAICTLGKAVSSVQLSKILQSPVEEVIIVLDPDAYKDALGLAMQISWYKKTKVVYWNGDKDVNDLGKVETLKRVKATTYGNYNIFSSLKRNIRA